MPRLPRYGRPKNENEIETFGEIGALCFGAPAAEIRGLAKKFGPGPMRLVRRDGQVVGGALLYAMGQWFAGRCVPMIGIGLVAVTPHERGTGAATRLMRGVVRELHKNGVALSALYPANLHLYRRAGYEIAGGHYEIRLPVRSIEPGARDLDVRELQPSDAAAVNRIYRESVRNACGPIDQSARGWQRALRLWRKPTYGVGAWKGKRLEGYIRYQPEWKNRTLRITAFAAATPAASLRLLTYLVDHRSQIEMAIWCGNPADPLFLQLGDPAYRVKLEDHWMLRIVDVPEALGDRGYGKGVEAAIHLDVRDDLVRDNHDRFVLEVSGGRGYVRRGGRGAIRIDIRGLASLYTGHVNALDLLEMTSYLEATRAQVQALQAVFAGPVPWMADGF